MSTEIKSTVTSRQARLEDIGGGEASIRMEAPQLTVSRADFLKAVADELDVIVVEKADLPDVQPRDPLRGYNVAAVRMLDGSDRDAAECRATALRWLALAEHLNANPPVDEAQVETIAKAVRAEDAARGINVGALDAYLAMARSLYRGGIRAREVTP